MYRNFGIDGDPITSPPPETSPNDIITRHHRPWFIPEDNDVEKILTIAKILISHGHWCQGHFATDVDDNPVDELDDTAHNYCIIGAIRRANHILPAPRLFAKYWRKERYQMTLRLMYKVINANLCNHPTEYGARVMSWNDSHQYGEILAGVSRAIVIAPYAEVV